MPLHSAALLFLLSLVVASVGCGIKSPPVPPSPQIPQPVQDLTAKQSGGKVLLRFTRPRQTTGGSRLETPPTLEIFRALLDPEETAEDLETVFSARAEALMVLRPQAQESFLAGDTIVFPVPSEPGMQATQTGGAAYYAVRALGNKGEQVGFSNLVAWKGLPVLLPPENFRAVNTETGIRLEWDASVSISAGEELQEYFIYRSEQTEEGPPAEFARLNLAPVLTLSYTDVTAEPGIRYTYVVTALDTSGNESAHSNQASATAPAFEQENE